jgi:hypothetical protein
MMMTLGEIITWAHSVGYFCEQRRLGLQLHEPVFLFTCGRCDYCLESVSSRWVHADSEGVYSIPLDVVWDLATHMSEHLAKRDSHRRRVGTEKGDRRLTSEEQAREVDAIRTRTWPHHHVLRVKNLYNYSFGCIYRGDDKPESIVSDVVMEVTNPQSGARWGGKAAYRSLEEMVEAGWVAD